MKVICDCQLLSQIDDFELLTFSNLKNAFITHLINFNYKVIKCYKLVFNKNNYKNLGTIFLFIIIIISVICLIVYIKYHNIEPVKNALKKFQPQQNNYKEERNELNSEMKEIEDNDEINNEIENKKKNSIELNKSPEKIRKLGTIKERKSIHKSNNLIPIISRPKSSFMQKNISNKNIKDQSPSQINSISITKQLLSPTSSNNLIIQTNQSSSSNINVMNSNTNNTINTNSTNVNNEISLSRSNIPLNSNRNRRNSFLLLNDDKNKFFIKKHHTKLKIEEKKENEKNHDKFNQGGFKLLNKPYLYVKFFIELNCFLIIFLGILMFEILTSKKNNRMFKSIVQTRNNIFQQFNFVCEMFIIYILSVLNNKEIIIPYIGNDLSYYCDETLKYKDNPLKNVYDFLNLCYPEIKEGVDNISLGKIESKLENTRKFLLQINSNDFCNSYSNFLYQNTLDSTIPDLTYLHDLDLNDLINECQNVGNVFNIKGLTTAFDTIIQVISYEYKDFILDKNRTEKSNLERLNNVYIQNIQVELERVLRKVTICYYIVFNWDYNNIEKKIINDKKWIYSLMVFVIVIIAFLYTYNIYIFSEDLKKLQFFKDCIVNSILFL
jgi:hypothetical protein